MTRSSLKNFTAYWDQRAESYSRGVVGELSDHRHLAWAKSLRVSTRSAVRAAHEQGRRPRALDLGCGPGFFSTILAEMGCLVDAVDASAEMLERAKANTLGAGVGDAVCFHWGDVSVLPFASNSFDLAVSRNVTWILAQPEAAYAEWLRVLRPGGKLLVYDANWYRYLVDDELNRQRLADQLGHEVKEWDEDARATQDEEKRCEELAAGLPLTPVMRPAWDVELLQRMGARDVKANTEVWRELWTESEQRFYATSPQFLVEATKELP